MENKVLLISVDGLRPDALEKCGADFLLEFAKNSLYNFQTQTVMPSVTLPCHTSLFYGVEPGRHGVLTNVWTPMVRPVKSLMDAVHDAGGVCGAFYNWEQLRDLWSYNMVDMSCYSNNVLPNSDAMMTDFAVGYILSKKPDFVFLYLGNTDHVGHEFGWMSQQYLEHVKKVDTYIRTIIERIPVDYHIIVTADHGGHDRCHGADIPEDMTIPLIINGPTVKPGKIDRSNILDVAPTVAKILGVQKPVEWEGKELV